MPIPRVITRFNKRYLNRLTARLVGRGDFAEVEHVGRRSGAVRRTVIMAFRHGDAVTVALTYGPRVDWLRNVRAAGGCRMRLGREVLTLGPPSPLDPPEGLRRMPWGPRHVLPLLHSEDFVELPVLDARPDLRLS